MSYTWTSHPSEEMLEAAVRERLDSETMDKMAAHIAECPDCQVRLDEMRTFVHAISAALIEWHSPRLGMAARALAWVRRALG